MAERQMATCMEEVRTDHRLRYEFAVQELNKRGKTGHVIDAGCGVGYGSGILSEAVEKVTAIEVNPDAFALYNEHWKRKNIEFHNTDLYAFSNPGAVDAVVCFEFLEHVEDYDGVLQRFAQWSDLLIISTPNEEVRPHLREPVNPFHFRHFRPTELADALAKHGMEVVSWHCQKSGAAPDLHEGTDGKFIIAVAERKSSTPTQ